MSDDTSPTTGTTPTGATRVTGLIGHPVAHSRSPAILNAAYREAGLDWIYVAFPVARGRGADAVHGARALGIAGLNVTMPHKADAAAACDELTPDAVALGAVNVVTVGDDGRARGSSTDGEGFVRSVRDEGFDPAGEDVLVAGAGGAARAIVLALGGAGARVTVAARRLDAATSAAALVPGGHAVALAEVDPGVHALVVNATPLGMQGEPGPVPVEALNPGQLVVDTVYHPMETPFLAACRARGIHAVNGMGMLVHQAALAFESWTGLFAPLPAMRVAAVQESPARETPR
jgi:shikimate dehydrogenase